jgi:hypothetical protein
MHGCSTSEATVVRSGLWVPSTICARDVAVVRSALDSILMSPSTMPEVQECESVRIVAVPVKSTRARTLAVGSTAASTTTLESDTSSTASTFMPVGENGRPSRHTRKVPSSARISMSEPALSIVGTPPMTVTHGDCSRTARIESASSCSVIIC